MESLSGKSDLKWMGNLLSMGNQSIRGKELRSMLIVELKVSATQKLCKDEFSMGRELRVLYLLKSKPNKGKNQSLFEVLQTNIT